MRLLSSIAAAFVIVGAACMSTSTAPLTSEPSPVPTRGPTSRPAGYSDLESTTAPYTVCYPAPWVSLERVPLDDGHDGDMFVGPAGSTVNMVATIVSEPADLESEAYAQAAIQNLRGRGVGVVRAEPMVVDGVPATVITFPRLTGNGQRYTVREVLWASAGRGWVYVLVHDPSLEGNAAQIASEMLGCFRGR